MSDFNRPTVEVNSFRKKTPLKATIVKNVAMVPETNESDVHHVVFSTEGYNYLEGQSVGVLPPGVDENDKPHGVRLYSIASLGNDAKSAEQLTVCIKRVVYEDEETGEEVRGVCSNYVSDLKVGDEVLLTGPAGRKFLLPEEGDRNRPYIFIATGTGIAPFRGMLQRLYNETENFDQDVYLVFGVRTDEELLYNDDFTAIKSDKFHYVTALSRQQKTADGSRMYVSHRIAEHQDALYELLQNDRCLIYLCGLKGMEDQIYEAFESVFAKNGKSKEELDAALEHRLLKEVY